MSKIQFSSTSLRVPLVKLWDVLMDSIKNPQNYVPGIIQCQILRQQGKEIIRKVKTSFGEFVEQIIIDLKNLEISFRLLRHPSYTGTTTTKITSSNGPDGFLLLTLTRDYQVKDPLAINHPNLDSLRAAIESVKRLAEAG